MFERFFQNKIELKTAKTWKAALQTREIQRNNYHATGDIKNAREFAKVMSHEVAVPAQVPEKKVQSVVIFSQETLAPTMAWA